MNKKIIFFISIIFLHSFIPSFIIAGTNYLILQNKIEKDKDVFSQLPFDRYSSIAYWEPVIILHILSKSERHREEEILFLEEHRNYFLRLYALKLLFLTNKNEVKKAHSFIEKLPLEHQELKEIIKKYFDVLHESKYYQLG